MEALTTVAKVASLAFFGFLASKFFAYIYSILIARTLGPSDLGIFTIATGVLGFVMTFANLGLPEGMMRYVAFYKSKGIEGKMKGTIVGGLLITIVSSAIFSILLFLSADYIGMGIYNLPSLSIILKIFAVIVPFGTIGSSLLLAIAGFKAIKYKIFVRNYLENVSKILLYVAFLLFGLRLMGAVFSLLLTYVISMAISFYFLEKRVYPFLRTKVRSEFDFKPLLNFSWPLLAASFFTLMLATIDAFMLGYMIDTATVGIYKVAETVALMLLISYNSLGTLAVPIFTGYFAVNKKHEMSMFFKHVTRWMYASTLPLLVLIMVFSQPIIDVLYGAVYSSGHIVLGILSIGFFIMAAVGPTQSILHAIGKPRYDLLNTVVAVVVNIILNLILIPPYGMEGAAIATMIAYSLWNVMSLAEVYVFLGIHPYGRGYLKPTFASAAMAAIAIIAVKSVKFDSLILLALAAILLSAFYTLVLLLMHGFEYEDVEIVKMIERKFGFRIPLIRNALKRFVKKKSQ